MIGQILGLGAIQPPQKQRCEIAEYVDDLMEALDRSGEITFVAAKGISHYRRLDDHHFVQVHASLAMLGIIDGNEVEPEKDGYDHIFRSGTITPGPAFEAAREFRRKDIEELKKKQRQKRAEDLGEAMDDEFLGGSP